VKHSFVPLASMAILAMVCAASAPASAGELERIEGAHKDKKKDRASSSSSSSGSSSSSSSDGGGDFLGNLIGGMISAMINAQTRSGTEDDAAAARSHALAMESYTEDRSSAYADLSGPDSRMRRYGELSLSAFSTLTPSVRALDTQMNVFLSALTLHGAVTRYYEPDTQNVQTLDLLRLQIGFNLLHNLVKNAELHVTGGVLGMHGNDWTTGGGARTELRLYPFRPFSLDCVGDATFFPHGPPLIEAQVLPGVTFARLDLRLGASMLYQVDQTPIIGPRVQVGIRF